MSYLLILAINLGLTVTGTLYKRFCIDTLRHHHMVRIFMITATFVVLHFSTGVAYRIGKFLKILPENFYVARGIQLCFVNVSTARL